MKKLLIIVFMPLLFVGCGTTSEQRIVALEQAVATVNGTSDMLSQKIDDINAIITTTRAALEDPNLPLANDFAKKLAEAQDELVKVLAAKEKADTVLRDLHARLAAVKAGGNIDALDEIGVAAGTLTAIGQAIGGQVGMYLAIIASILSALSGLGLGKKREREITTNIIKSIDKAVDAGAIDMKVAGPIMALKQTSKTKAIVDKVQST